MVIKNIILAAFVLLCFSLYVEAGQEERINLKKSYVYAETIYSNYNKKNYKDKETSQEEKDYQLWLEDLTKDIK